MGRSDVQGKPAGKSQFVVPSPDGSANFPWNQANNVKVDRFRNNPDYKWTEGWELITKYTGYNNQNTVISPPQFEHPYVVLYNKYSGVLRVFFAFSKAPTQALFNGAKFEIRFVGTLANQYVPSLLDLVSESPTPLSKGGAKYAIGEAMSDYDNIDLDWFFADFPMQYDPCTRLYASKVQIRPLLISCNDLQLQGTITGTLQPIQNNRVQDGNKKFSYGQAAAAYKKVNNTYKDIASIVNDINVKVGKVFANDEAKKSVIANAVNAFSTNLNAGAKDALKTLPWLGTALSLFDFVTTLGKTAGPQQVQISNTAIDMTASLKGTLCGQGSFGSIIFHTPGSSGIPSTETAQYPMYNEALGIFNLIDSPQVIRRQTQIGIYWLDPGCTRVGECPFIPIYKQEFRLKLPVKYALNPASKLQIREVQGAFITETRDSTQISGWNVLGKNTLNNKWLQSTRLIGIDTLSDFIFRFDNGGAPGTIQGPLSDGYIKIVMRLTRTNDPTGPGIIYSAKYPLQIVMHSTASTSTDIGTVTNGATANPNYFTPLTTAEVSTFCNSTRYKSRDRLYSIREDNSAANSISEELEGNNVNVYPNPATKNVRVDFFNSKAQTVTLKIVNASGQEIKSLSKSFLPEGKMRKTYNVSGLSNGMYYLTIEMGGQTTTRKILISK